jgi:hypothetical protein
MEHEHEQDHPDADAASTLRHHEPRQRSMVLGNNPPTYWALAERGVQIDFASPSGGEVGWTPYSDPYSEVSEGPRDLVSKGFLSDSA